MSIPKSKHATLCRTRFMEPDDDERDALEGRLYDALDAVMNPIWEVFEKHGIVIKDTCCTGVKEGKPDLRNSPGTFAWFILNALLLDNADLAALVAELEAMDPEGFKGLSGACPDCAALISPDDIEVACLECGLRMLTELLVTPKDG